MKNKYLTKRLCITLLSSMILASPLSVYAADAGELFSSGIESAAQTSAEFTSEESAAVPQETSKSSQNPSNVAPESGVSEEITPAPVEPAPETTVPTTPASPSTPENNTESGSSAIPTPDFTDSPENSQVTPTPGVTETPENPTVTPTPGVTETPENPTVTPTPGVTDTPEEPTVTPTPGVTGTPENPTVTPTPGVTETPENPTVTPTPGVTETPENSTVTPTPGVSEFPEDPTVTPTPEVSVTPTPSVEVRGELIEALIKRIDALKSVVLTLEQEKEIQQIRTEYDSLTKEEKTLVTNYNLLLDYEKTILALKEEKNVEFTDEPVVTDDAILNVITGTPVYYTNMVSNLHAGKEFYLDSLKENYQLVFSDDFASVMDAIEAEYKQKNKLMDKSDLNGTGLTSSEDTLLVRNWQDILAVYVYQQSKQGVTNFTLDASCKDALAEIFAEMNPVVRDKQDITKVYYGNYHINYYIKEHNIPKADREILKKYVETDCKLLCATVTAAKGFVRQSVGEDVSEERVNVITAAYSLVGEVGYFWGGKSTALGADPNWGSTALVSAEGSNSTGTLRAFGLDCSGFVTWAVVNGYQSSAMQSYIGDGTSDQWVKANVVSEAEAQPGDLVFQRGPEAGSDNHVGIICGKTDSGDWIAVHCSSSKNGVTVGEAYGASFRYIRQPSFYPAESEISIVSSEDVVNTDVQLSDEILTSVTVPNTLQDLIGQKDTFTSEPTQILTAGPILVDETEEVIFVSE